MSKPGRKKHATSQGGVYRYALAKLHKTICEAQEDPGIGKALYREFAECNSWRCTVEILKSHHIDIFEALDLFFENTITKVNS